MNLNFVSTGKKFPYPYYIGIISALQNSKCNVVLHILEEPESEYFDLLKKDTRLTIKKIEIDKTLPVFNMDFYTGKSLPNMVKNWKFVMMFDYLIWKIVSQEGGVVMGLDSITLSDWVQLLPNNKEMLISLSPRSKDKTAFTMHGVVVKENSQLAKKIFADIEQVAQRKDIEGKHRAIIDGKYRWGGLGMVPYLNNVINNMDKVEIADIEKYTIPMFASSMEGFDTINEKFVTYSSNPLVKLIRQSLPVEKYNPFNKVWDIPVQNKDKFRCHLLGLVHLPCSKNYLGCAFTQKNYKLAQMLLSLGHEVFYYGAEGSTVPCTKFIQTHTLKDIQKEWGEGDNRFEIGYDFFSKGFKHDFNTTRTETTKKFYEKCIEEINKSKQPDDFLLITQGLYHKPIDDAVKLYLTAETGIGYRGSYAKFRAFESAYIQNFTYGSQHPFKSLNGNYYDRVIPNYFDPDDITYSTEKRDYFLYIGRIIKRKGIVTAYLISKELGIPLVIAGQDGKIDRDGSLYNDFRIQKGNWEYIGFADIERRKELMAHARATIVATEYLEPFAGTHIESMLSGTPVITTDFGVFPSTVLQGLNGFRCNTLNDFIRAGRNVIKLNPLLVRKSAEQYLMDNVKYLYQKWFTDLYKVYESTIDKTKKGWHYIEKGLIND